jgi:hypothetical protein
LKKLKKLAFEGILMDKHALVLVVCLILVSSIVPSVLPSPYVTTKKQWICSPFLTIYIEAPEESRINESYSVIIEVDPIGKVYINSINVEFDNPSYKETILFNIEISSEFTKTYNLKPEYEGSSECNVKYDYVIFKGTEFEESYCGSFHVYLTEIREKTYDELEDAYYSLKWDYGWLNSSYNSLKLSYETLSSSYNSLKENYRKLERDYDDLYEKFEEQTKGTMFYALTTLIFALTTVYFAWKCRKLGKMQGKGREEKKEGLIKKIEALFFKVD